MATLDPRATNRRLVDQFITDVWNGADLDAIEELTTDDLVVHHLGAGVDRDRDAFRSFHGDLLDAIPDLEHVVEALVVDGDTLVAQVMIHGTPERQVGPLRPTGESFSVAGFQRYRVVEGRVAELWVLPNGMGMLRDLGVFPDSLGELIRLVAGAAKGRLLGR